MEGTIDVGIVAEDPTWRQWVLDTLTRAPGVRTSLVLRSAAEALHALRELPAPRVLLLALAAPDPTSLDLLAYLRVAAPATSTVLVSAVTEEAAVLAAIRAGAVGYLRPPIDAERLVESIRTADAGGAPLDATIARQIVQHLHARPARTGMVRLTDRERQIMGRLVEGGSLKELAASMGLSPHTVDTHVRNIYAKLGVRTKSAAVAKALRDGIA